MRARRTYLMAFGGLLALGAYSNQPAASLQAAETAMTSDAVVSLVIDVLNRRTTGGCGNCKDTIVHIGPEDLDFHLFPDVSQEPEHVSNESEHGEFLSELNTTVTLPARSSTSGEFDERKVCYVDVTDQTCHTSFFEGDCNWHSGCEELSVAALAQARTLGRSKNFAGLMRAVAANPRLSIDVDNAAILVADCSGRVSERISLQSSVAAAMRHWRSSLS